jgi:hypothetical protein
VGFQVMLHVANMMNIVQLRAHVVAMVIILN